MAEVERQQVGQPVELVYVPMARDMVSALRARTRATPVGRRMRRLLHFAGVLCTVCFGYLVLMNAMTWRLWLMMGAGVLAFACLYLLPWVQGRQLHQPAARQGEFRAVVDDSGIRLTTRDADATTNWAGYARYAETDDVFVLLTGDRHSIRVMVLPKRGVTEPAGTERPRTLLERHLEKAP
ncbi:YcxB family protein [Streptomyces sp. NPDC002835]